MSFRDIMQGACGQLNPVLQVASHFTQDLSLREGLAAGIGIAGAAAAVAASTTLGQGHGHQNAASATRPTTFQMDQLLQEAQAISNSGIHIQEAQNWSKEFTDQMLAAQAQDQAAAAEWTLDYAAHQQSEHMPPIWNECEAAAASTIQTTPAPTAISIIHPTQMVLPLQHPQEILADSKWVGTTAQAQPTELMTTAKELLETVRDPKIQATEFMTYVEKLSTGEVELGSKAATTSADLAQQWVNDYEYEFSSDLASPSEATEFWQKMQEEWDRLGAEDATSTLGAGNTHPWLQEYETYNSSAYTATASAQNPYSSIADPFQEGLRLLRSGDIPSAALAFESAVQKDPENSEAWFHLGTTQAQNEQDPLAIAALQKCLQLQPGHLDALMSLGASLTNESYHLQACSTLLKWLESNPKYTDLVRRLGTSSAELFTPTSLQVSSRLSPDQLSTVQKAFIQAARLFPKGQSSDPDVQSGLGILFNLGNEYEKAADCFQSALSHRPDDALLWNRLGATLANGGISAEAISAYRRALELSPGFIRTRYNLGISCVNLNAWREAAEHFLFALNQQASGKSQTQSKTSLMSDSIWTSLRMVLHLLDRKDLSGAVTAKDLGKLNHEFNIVGHGLK